MEEYFMIPLLDENFVINGVQIYITFQNGQRKVFNLDNFSNDTQDNLFKNKITKSGYKIYNKGLCYEFILVESKLSC